MTRLRLLPSFAAALFCAVSSSQAAAGPAPALPKWLAGEWVNESQGVTSIEAWTAPEGGMMFGRGQRLRAGKTEFFELLTLRLKDGGIVYRAWPEGAQGTPFKCTSSPKQRLVCDNPTHDFPQRIEYWREDDVLRAKISGRVDGKLRERAFQWRRRGPRRD